MDITEVLAGNCENILVRQYPNADRLIFAFSHVSFPAGKFAMTNIFANETLRANIIFINCKGNAWYQLGINDEYNSIDKSKELFQGLLSYFMPNQSLAVGMSMGGYAATLFGLLLNLDYITALTPEIILGLPHCRSTTLNDVRQFDFRYISLQHLLAVNKRTIINAIYGAYDFIDLSLLWPISQLLEQSDGKLRVTFCSDGHQVPLSLDVGNLVSSTFIVGSLEPRDIRASLVLKAVHCSIELYAFARAMHYKNLGDYKAVHDVLTGEESFSKISWINYFLAENFKDAGQAALALDQFTITAQQDPNSYYVWFRFAQFAESISKFDIASQACNKALSIKPQDIHATQLLGRLKAH